MKRFLLLILSIASTLTLYANKPDKGYLFSYINGRGLAFAFSSDGVKWSSIGNGRTFFDSDFGTWGAEKKMTSLHLVRDEKQMWRCVFSPREDNAQFAYTESPDLINWKPQDYPYVEGGSCRRPVLISGGDGKGWVVMYSTLQNEIFAYHTTDFRTWHKANVSTNESEKTRESCLSPEFKSIKLDGRELQGQIHIVEWEQIDKLIKRDDFLRNRQVKLDEHMGQDPVRFADLKPVKSQLRIDGSQHKQISNELIGIFFEDISYGADGGLYGELIENRDFEYSALDHGSWHSLTAWELKGEGSTIKVLQENPIHPNNSHYLALGTSHAGATLENDGYFGIKLTQGESYYLNFFSRKASPSSKSSRVKFSLVDENGQIVASKSVTISSSAWRQSEYTLKAEKSCERGRLLITPLGEGEVHMDMISLFPHNTFKQRRNGLRADLAQAIADLKPKFVRFPGGCVAHGNGLDNMYLWKRTIGKLEERKHMPNIWNYHQTLGLGYYEYFLFCEDIGAEPLPVIPAAVPCQNSWRHGHGQQGGVDMEHMDEYIQDIFDLIEWANGDKSTKWGKLRAEAGHPEPFNLKYIGIGNEDLISEVFTERFNMIYDAVREKHPEITICGTVGPFYEGSDYEWGWKLAKQKQVPMVDEHYYVSPGWFIHNQDYYDHYDRNASQVYLGEYACHLAGRQNNIETALCEALHLINVERNADIVRMTSYAPLLARYEATNWNPDMIYFNSSRVDLTPGYYTQKIFGNNSGDSYIDSSLRVESRREDVRKRIATSVVSDSESGDIIIKMVNLLPTEVSTRVVMDGCPEVQHEATCTLLSGSPTERNATPQQSQIEVGKEFDYTMPAYSFSTIRVKRK